MRVEHAGVVPLASAEPVVSQQRLKPSEEWVYEPPPEDETEPEPPLVLPHAGGGQEGSSSSAKAPRPSTTHSAGPSSGTAKSRPAAHASDKARNDAAKTRPAAHADSAKAHPAAPSSESHGPHPAAPSSESHGPLAAPVAHGRTQSRAHAHHGAASPSGGDDVDDVSKAESDAFGIDDLLVGLATAAHVRRLKPPSGNVPLPINISLVVTELFDINQVTGTMRVQGQLVMQWRDARLELPPNTTRVQLANEEVWAPQVDYYNSVDLKTPATKTALAGSRGDARVVRTQRFVGLFTAKMSFVFYPGDKHVLPVHVELFGNPIHHAVFDPQGAMAQIAPGASSSSLWSADAVTWRVQPVEKVATGLYYDRLSAELHVSRLSASYVESTYLPLLFVLLLAYSSYFIDPKAVPARAAFTIISLLASITLYQGVTHDLPSVGYFCFVHFACLLVALAAAASTATFVVVHWHLRMAAKQKVNPPQTELAPDWERRAETLERTCRTFFPVYIVLCLFVFLVPFVYAAFGVHPSEVHLGVVLDGPEQP